VRRSKRVRRSESSSAEPRSELDARRALAVAAGGLGLVFLAFFFDAAPLFVPGVALFATGALAPAWVWSSTRGARVRRHLAAQRIVEDEPLAAVIEVRRPLGIGGWGRLEVLDPLTSARLRLGGPGSPLRGSRAARVQVVARFPRRGEQQLSPPSLTARDPLDLARAVTPGDGVRQTVLVLPRTEPVRWLGPARSRRLKAGEGDAASEALAAVDLEGLRPYRPGTPASRIYWPAVARGQGLVERRLQADGDRRPLVVLDARERGVGASRDPTALDAAVRAAASLVLGLARTGGCGLLLPGQPRATIIDSELTAWPAAYARLALVGTDADPHPARAPMLASASGRTGPLVYVTAASHERLAASLAASAGRSSVLLVVPESELVDGRPRGAGARAVPALAVSGCRGFTLGAPRRHGPDVPVTRTAGAAGAAG
jgi:uncharacterized protein (DUF58 family)